jgi:hypothetical protein
LAEPLSKFRDGRTDAAPEAGLIEEDAQTSAWTDAANTVVVEAKDEVVSKAPKW